MFVTVCIFSNFIQIKKIPFIKEGWVSFVENEQKEHRYILLIYNEIHFKPLAWNENGFYSFFCVLNPDTFVMLINKARSEKPVKE